MEMEHDMGGVRGGLRGFDGAVEEEERGLLECSVCAAFFLTQKSHIHFIS